MRIRTKFSRHSTCRSGVCLPAKIVKGGRQNENLFPILSVAHLVLSMAHLVVHAVPLCPCHPVASVAPLPLCMPPLVYQNRLSFCPSRLGYVQAGPVVSKPPSALPKPSPAPPPPVPPEPPPFSVKTTINRAPKRYFYTPFAPNEKNFVYLHSLSGRISTSFIGCRAVAEDGGDGSGGPKPRTRDYGSGYPYGKSGTAGMLGAKHNNCCNNEQRRNHQARKRADVGKDGCRCSVVQGR